MEAVGVVVGIAIAVAVEAYFRDRAAMTRQRVTQTIAAVLVAGTAAALAGVGIRYFFGSPDTSTPDQVMASVRASPLMGIVLRDYPEAEARMRAAIARDRQNRPATGPSQTFLVGLEVREAYIVPALLRASDETVIAVSKAQGDLIRRLQASDLRACRASTQIGIERPDLLAPDARTLFERGMRAMESAYVSGRTATGPVPAVISDERAGELLTLAGLAPADFERLRRLASLGDVEACNIGVRLVEAPTKIPPRHQAALARYLVAR